MHLLGFIAKLGGINIMNFGQFFLRGRGVNMGYRRSNPGRQCAKLMSHPL